MSIETELQDFEEEEYLPTLEHAVLESNLITALSTYVKANKLGRVAGSSAEYRFLEDSSRGRQPDISFVKQENLPARLRSYPDVPPDLAIEIESPSDKPYEMQAKIAEYQKAGVSMVWVVHPYTRTVDVYRSKTGVVPHVVGGEDELSGEDIILGLRLSLKDLFDYPLDPDPIPEIKKSGKKESN